MREAIKSLNRILDANINRLKEGLRVCEEVSRFILEDKKLTSLLKDVRHGIDQATKRLPLKNILLKQRDSRGDIGKNILGKELKRKGIDAIFSANIQRAKESARVLEEFSKLIDTKASLCFKRVRYEVYEIEKKAARKIATLPHNR